MFETIYNCFQSIWSYITKDEYADRVLTADDKQTIYDRARDPVNKLYEERSKLRDSLSKLPKKSDESQKIRERIREIDEKIPDAEKKAAKTIFDKTNSAKDMGKGKFDFHGLHVNEAKIIARDVIMTKFSSTTKEITIITGRGQHSYDGRSKLKDEMRVYFMNELNLNCENVPGNEGALLISKKPAQQCTIL
jgi:DNA-nicking Smr family endonuclease